MSEKDKTRVVRWLDSAPPGPDAGCVMRDWREVASRIEAARAEVVDVSCHSALEAITPSELARLLNLAAGFLSDARLLAKNILKRAEDALEKERAGEG